MLGTVPFKVLTAASVVRYVASLAIEGWLVWMKMKIINLCLSIVVCTMCFIHLELLHLFELIFTLLFLTC